MKTKSALIFSLFAASVAGIPVFAQESVADEKLELVAAGTVTEAENVVSRRYPGRVVSPALSTIHQPVGKIAELAFGTLQRRIRGDNLPPCEILVDAPVVVRKSTLGTNESAHSGKRTCKCGNERKKS